MAQKDMLLPWLTVAENICIGLRLRGEPLQDMQVEKVKKLIEDLELSDAAHFFPRQLSAGMCQRVALGRTLFEDKPIILMDEPFSQLDVLTKLRLQELSVKLFQNKIVLLITHDPLEALQIGQDIFVLSGFPAKLYSIAKLDSSVPRKHLGPEQIAVWDKILEILAYSPEVFSDA